MLTQEETDRLEKKHLGQIYRVRGQTCLFQKTLDNSPRKAILHDYRMMKDDGVYKLVCRSCGFTNFCWKDIFKSNYGY